MSEVEYWIEKYDAAERRATTALTMAKIAAVLGDRRSVNGYRAEYFYAKGDATMMALKALSESDDVVLGEAGYVQQANGSAR